MSLILHLDENNYNSWSGEPTENAVANPEYESTWIYSPYGGSICTISYISSSQWDNWPTMQISNLTVVEPGYPRIVDKVFNSIITGIFSVSVEVSGSIGDQLHIRIYENGSTKITNAVNITKSGWQTYKFQNQSTTYNLNQPYFFPNIISDSLYIRKLQIENKEYSTNYINGSRSYFYDLSGNNNNGNVDNMDFSATQQGLVYNGSSNYIPTIDTIDLRQNFTICCWAKIKNQRNKFSFVGHGTPITNGGLHIWFRDENIIRFGMYSNDRDSGNLSSIIELNKWYFFTFTYNHSTYEKLIYIDSIKPDQIDCTGPAAYIASPTILRVGQIYSSTDLGETYGKIENFKIYNEALSELEIQNEYNRYRTRYNKPPISGSYTFGSLPGPLLYEFNSLSETSLRGEETENVHPHPTDIYSWVSSGSNCSLNRDTIKSPVGNTPIKMICNANDSHMSSYGNNAIWNLSSAEAGESWTVSVYAKANRTISDCEIFIFGQNSTSTQWSTQYQAFQRTVTTKWTRITATFTFTNPDVAFIQTRLDGPHTTFEPGDIVWWDGLQVEKKSYPTPFTPNYRYNWESIRNLVNRQYYGSFMNDGYSTYPLIDNADHNGLKLESSSSTVGNFVVLQKPNIVKDGLILHLDAGNKDSYPGTGTTWYDLSGNRNNFTISSGLTFSNSDNTFTLTSTADNTTNTGMYKHNPSEQPSTSTIIYFIKTTDVQSLFLKGISTNWYLGAYRSGNKEYYSNCGTPVFYMDTVEKSNIYDYIRDGNWHMLEFKNVDISTWTQWEFNNYSGYDFGNGNLSIFLIYNRALSSAESLQNFNALRGRFNL